MDIVALSNGLYGSISVDWVAPPLWNIHMTNNAVYKRIEKFSKKCKKRG